MSLIGKILSVLNIFGLLGLTVFGIIVYTKQQSWQYANFRHDLAIKGEPQHKEEIDEEGHVKFQDLGPQTLKDLNPTDSVATQKEEVENVRRKFDTKLKAESDKGKQTALYAAYLLPMAETNSQRERLLSVRKHLADPKMAEQLKLDLKGAYDETLAELKVNQNKPVELAFAGHLNARGGEPRTAFEPVFLKIVKEDRISGLLANNDPMERDKGYDTAFLETVSALNTDLKTQWDREFEQVVVGEYQFPDDKGGVKKQKMTEEERKAATSTLLFNLVEAELGEASPDAKNNKPLYTLAAYKRYITIVGLATANRTINSQAMKLSRILSDQTYEQVRDRERFAATLLPIIDQSKETARAIERLTVDLEIVQAKVRDQDTLVKAKQRDVEEAEKELAAYRKDTADKLVELRAMSKAVFEKRLEVRDKTVTNQEDERKIRELEGWRWLPFVGGSFLISREEP